MVEGLEVGWEEGRLQGATAGTSKDVGISDGYPWFNVDPIMAHNG